jgi:hypothetical protein
LEIDVDVENTRRGHGGRSPKCERASREVTRNMKTKTLFIGLLLGITLSAAGADDIQRITIRVSPALSFAPANLIVRTTIASDPENRAVEVVAESPEFYRSSEIQLEGERAPRTSVFEFRSLPPGRYEVRATLRGSSGRERASVHEQVNVMASAAGS